MNTNIYMVMNFHENCILCLYDIHYLLIEFSL